MQTADMLRMANQISDFFRSYDEAYAKKEIATHINSFWDPRMRKMFFAHIDAGGEGFNDLVKAAAELIKRPKV
jgi:formate dehydrogenase subunit delta